MKNNKIFGYDYNEKEKKYTINENEARVVEAISDLYVNARLHISEISSLLNGNKTIFELIAERIYDIFYYIEGYGIIIESKFNNIDLVKYLENSRGCDKKIIELFDEIKLKINEIDTINKEYVFKDIEDIIHLLKRCNKIFEKYGDFKWVEKIKNQKNIRSNLYIGEFLNTK